MKSWPLKWRLSLVIIVTLFLTSVIIYIVAYIELRESLLKNLEPALNAMAEGLLSEIEGDEDRKTREAEFSSIIGYSDMPHSNQYRIWMEGNDKDLFASNSPAEVQVLLVNLPHNIQPDIGEFVFFDLNPKKQRYHAVWTRRILEQGTVNVLVATSSSYVYHEMEEFRQLLTILGGSLLAVSLLLVPAIVAWTLRPIDEVAAIVRQVKPGNVKREPLQNLKAPHELLPFVEALDEMLVRLDKAIKQQKQFTADASHELRTSLAVIKSTIQTTRMADRDVGDYIKALDDTLQDVDRMEQLIGHLLSLARLDESGGLSDTVQINLEGFLIDLVEIFDARVSQQGGKVICDNCIPTLINGNENELGQLFTNILDNAVKYGPPNGLIRVTLVHEPEGYATVCIHDEGGQIPSGSVPHLFDRFYRIDSSRSHATGGAGLGLAISQEIARRHNGRIEITSDTHMGTSVFVRLPRLSL